MRKLLAYSDEISVQPGQHIEFKVSSEIPGEFNVKIVHIRCGDNSPEGPGLKQTEIKSQVSGHYPARYQKTQVGSYIEMVGQNPEITDAFTLQAMIWPTLLGHGEQAIAGAWNHNKQSGYLLYLDAQGRLSAKLGDGSSKPTVVSTDTPLNERRWCLVAVTFDVKSGILQVLQQPQDEYASLSDTRAHASVHTQRRPDLTAPFLIAAWNEDDMDHEPRVAGIYNGKIDNPKIFRQAIPLNQLHILKHRDLASPFHDSLAADWDFSHEIKSTTIVDLSVNEINGRTVNLPTRAMTGWNHDASEMNWTHQPGHYGAIHFHEDDVYDCGWETDVRWKIPDDQKSGTYAAYFSQADHWFYAPFYVRPKKGKPTAKLCLLIATASYYAYLNNQMPVTWDSLEEHSSNTFTVLSETDLHLKTHPEHGLSMYDNHTDGSGVCYASRLRPFMKMGPTDDLWQYNADTHITDWLEETDIEFDVITDDDLNAEGVELIRDYTCVMTTTHPEYYSHPMMISLINYQNQGGRFIYMGGNGFYWRVAYHPELPGVIEMRRAEDGMRSWIAEPGEYYMSFTGELSGLWRRNGIPPEQICGTGFSAQGFNHSRPYERTAASHDPRVEWMFENIAASEPIGDFGLVFGGAAGSEIDSADYNIGTVPHALIVAEASNFGADFHWVNEEFLHTHSAVNGENCPHVRCDMVFYETPKGGAVFSASSIAFSGALSHNQYQNNVSRLLANVVRRFLDPAAFEVPS